jgi:4-amino-4-deoxy-L-arabinose transferase-like glycosyltransferase
LPTSILAKRGWLLLFLAIAAFYLYGLAAIPLVGPDEPLYAEVAREMFVHADLITPTLGGHFWFEKPPLLYWFMIAGYGVLGIGEYAARLGPAISGLVTGGFVFWIGKAIDSSSAVNDYAASERDNLGRFGALAWLSSMGAMVFSRGASFDTLITMSVAAALACFFVWHLGSLGGDRPVGAKDSPEARARVWPLLGFYFFIGVSLLAKGMVGAVITFGVIAIYLLLRREWPQARFLKSLLWGIPFTFMVAGVWYGPMIHRHGWRFIDQFIVQHHLVRYVTNKYHQPRPFYYYVPVLPALFALDCFSRGSFRIRA